MRYFVALDLPDAVRQGLLEASKELRKWSSLRWTPLGSLHLTLRFLGELTDHEAARVRAELPHSMPRMKLRIDGLGSFPPRGALRVIWAGMGGDLETLSGLASVCERGAVAAGLPPATRPFHPHVTLARVVSPRGTAPLGKAVAALSAAVRSDYFEPSGATLFSSELSARGAVYTAVQTLPIES
ncbi:MAG: RNA 2',3'-cyclic phosphodiesterase [Planctomycetota bacterium]|nr:RNA 2',3'-cyclic phosphodiesterase [Planctomycetota bacterium]